MQPLAACNIDVLPLQFGVINPLHISDSDSATLLTITCDVPASYAIALGAGSGSFAERHLQSAERTLGYNLYIDTTRSQVWGDGTAGTFTVEGNDDGTTTTHTIYARVPAQPHAEPGTYGDSIVVTVSF